jgi:hypothetical protein
VDIVPVLVGVGLLAINPSGLLAARRPGVACIFWPRWDVATFTNERRLSMDDRPGGWVRYFPSRHGTVGQMVRLAGAPAAIRRAKPGRGGRDSAGRRTWIRALVTVAATTWSMTAGEVIQVPKELADAEIRAGRARRAKPSKIPAEDE